MANYDHIGWQNRFSFGNDNIYPKCASKKVSEMEISRISWKHIFNKLPLIQMRIDLVQIVTFAYINGTQTYEAYLMNWVDWMLGVVVTSRCVNNH